MGVLREAGIEQYRHIGPDNIASKLQLTSVGAVVYILPSCAQNTDVKLGYQISILN